MTDAELTRLLAERVMGWRIWKGTEHQGDHDWLDNPANFPHLTEFNTEAFTLWRAPNEQGRRWRPLDSMDDAWMLVERLQEQEWMLVERLQEQDWDYEVGSCLSADGEGHVALFSRGAYDPYSDARDEAWDAFAPTPQRAIALAALRAVGVEVD